MYEDFLEIIEWTQALGAGGWFGLAVPVEIGRRLVCDAASESRTGVAIALAGEATRGNEDVFVDVVGKARKGRIVVRTGRLGQMLVEAGDGRSDGVGGSLGVGSGAAVVLALEFGDGFEVAEGFGFDGFGLVGVVEDGFEFLFFPEQCAHGLGVIE